MQLSPKRPDNQFIQGDAATSRLLCGPSMQIAADPHIEAAFERLIWLDASSRTGFQVLVDGVTERLLHLAHTEAIEQDQVRKPEVVRYRARTESIHQFPMSGHE